MWVGVGGWVEVEELVEREWAVAALGGAELAVALGGQELVIHSFLLLEDGDMASRSTLTENCRVIGEMDTRFARPALAPAARTGATAG